MYKLGINRLIFGILLFQLAPWTYSFSAPSPPANGKVDCNNPAAPGPEMIRSNTSLLKDPESEEYSTEWVAYEQLKNLLKAKTSCQFPNEQVAQTSLYVDPTLKGGPLLPDTRVQIFGVGILRTARRGQSPRRVVAYPAFGPTTLSEYIESEEELATILKVLTQLEFVYVPYIEQISPEQSCYKLSSTTLVPSRVFDETLPWSQGDINRSPHLLPSKISLEVQRQTLERLAAEAKWIEILSTYEPSNRCETRDRNGQIEQHYHEMQVRSLDVAVNQLLPEREYLRLSAEFWHEVKKRIHQLRALDASKMKKVY